MAQGTRRGSCIGAGPRGEGVSPQGRFESDWQRHKRVTQFVPWKRAPHSTHRQAHRSRGDMPNGTKCSPARRVDLATINLPGAPRKAGRAVAFVAGGSSMNQTVDHTALRVESGAMPSSQRKGALPRDFADCPTGCPRRGNGARALAGHPRSSTRPSQPIRVACCGRGCGAARETG